MNMCAHVGVCLCAFVYMSIYVYACVCDVCMHVCGVCVHVCVVCVCLCVCLCVYIGVLMYVLVHVCVVCVHSHVYAYTSLEEEDKNYSSEIR